MIKINSISGLLFLVKDLSKTTEFYEKLGFQFKEKTADHAKAYINWFWIEFVADDKAEEGVFQKLSNIDKTEYRGSGQFVEVSVQNVDEHHEALLAKGLKPASQPQDFSWGRREFVIIDPDGYRLTFFEKK
ncbi:MAG TPA: VOC family protein [Candidatus Saccharimonadales bacterium]|nr:VOC family protein [Candidatus Saccharimonadales bacterium]